MSLAALLFGACTTTAPVQEPVKPSITENLDGVNNAESVKSEASLKAGSAVSLPSSSQWTHAQCGPVQQLDQQPRLRRHTKPIISSQWFPDGLKTTVTFFLEVTSEGKLGSIQWQPVDTDPRIVKAIQKSLTRWRFKPGVLNGQNVASCFEQPYELIFPPINRPAAVTP